MASERGDGEAAALLADTPGRAPASAWSSAFSSILARLTDASAESDHRDRDRGAEASISGSDGPLGSPRVQAQGAEASLASRSLGGILRQLSGRQGGGEAGRLDAAETTAAAAERHRLTRSGSSLDFQALTNWIERNAPFLAIMCLVFISQHILGLLVFGGTTAALLLGNSFVRRQVALKEGRRVPSLLAAALLFAAAPPLLLLSLPHSCLSWRTAVLLLPKGVESVWDCLFCITVGDSVVRMLTMVFKLGMVACVRPTADDSLRRRGQLLTLVEHASLLYRALVPTPLWFMYLYRSRGVVASVFTGAYLATKCQFVYERANNVVASVRSAWRREAQYGKFLSAEEAAELGAACAICQEPMTRPFQLSACRHAFCDACLTEWLERQSTCPMCRAVVRPPGQQPFGNGAVSLLPQLF